jgi:hypothetical protein
MSLKNLIALQKGKPSVADESSAPTPVRSEAAASKQTGSDSSAPVAEPIPSDAASAPAPEAPKKAGLGLNLVGAGRAVGAASPRKTPAGVGKRHGGKPDGDGDDSGSDDGAVFGLADLAGFEATEDTAPSRAELDSGFDDEIEATAPERALEPDLTVQQLAFVESLDGIYPVLHDPDLFGQAVRIIMLEMQEHPEYKKLLADQDVHTMIRGMRNTMGLARIRKVEKSRKAGGAGKKASRSKSAVSDEDMALLDAVMGGFGDD